VIEVTQDVSDQLDPRLQRLFEREVLHQWEFAAASLRLLKEGLQESGAGDPDGMAKFWFALDAALGALGNISKVFFPASHAPEETRRRCGILRRKFDVADDALLGNRELRNAFEHFDERIDQWYRTSKRRNFLDRSIGPKSAIQGVDPGDYMRWFDPSTMTLSVMGEELELPELVAEVESLLERVRQSFGGQEP
jgi:hypothetical protein